SSTGRPSPNGTSGLHGSRLAWPGHRDPSCPVERWRRAEAAVANPTSTERTVRTRVYRAGRLEAADFTSERVSDYLAEGDATVRVDFCAPDRVDLDVVADELGLHALAVDDAVTSRQRPKLDRYETHDFLNVYAVALDRGTGQLALSELSAFITPRALVT